MFPNMQVVSGRLKHDAKRRSERHRKDLVARARAVWSSVHEDSFPCPDSVLLAAADTLDDLSARWTGRTFEVEWRQPPRAMRRTSRASSS